MVQLSLFDRVDDESCGALKDRFVCAGEDEDEDDYGDEYEEDDDDDDYDADDCDDTECKTTDCPRHPARQN